MMFLMCLKCLICSLKLFFLFLFFCLRPHVYCTCFGGPNTYTVSNLCIPTCQCLTFDFTLSTLQGPMDESVTDLAAALLAMEVAHQ